MGIDHAFQHFPIVRRHIVVLVGCPPRKELKTGFRVTQVPVIRLEVLPSFSNHLALTLFLQVSSSATFGPGRWRFFWPICDCCAKSNPLFCR